MYLKNRANKDKSCFPAVGTIAGDLKILYDFDARQADLDDIKVKYGEVVIDLDSEEVIYAFTRDAYVLIQSTGGASSDADSIPFNVKLIGKPEESDFDIATETFTAVTP